MNILQFPVHENPAPRAFEGRNFVTPDVHRYYVGKRSWYELSSGPGIFDRNRLWGVTVTRDKVNRDFDACKCFNSEGDALRYIMELEAQP